VINCAAVTEVEATGVGAIRTETDDKEAGDVNFACQSNDMAENLDATEFWSKLSSKLPMNLHG